MAGHPEILFRCWSCHYTCQHQDGISLLRGGTEPNRTSQVCRKCWKAIPIAQRILVMRMVRPLEEGGMGLAEAVRAMFTSADKLEKLASRGEEWRDPPPKDMKEFYPDDPPRERDPDFNP